MEKAPPRPSPKTGREKDAPVSRIRSRGEHLARRARPHPRSARRMDHRASSSAPPPASPSSPWCIATAPAIRWRSPPGRRRTASSGSSLAADWVYVSLTAINLSWAQELATYMFVWMAKFGAALGVRTGIHVGVDVFVKQLSPAARKPVIVFALLCGALFTGIIGTLGAIYVYELDRRPGVAGARVAELDHLSVHSARLLSDVLPLPAGDVALPADRATSRIRATASNTRLRRPRSRRRAAPRRRAGAMTGHSEALAPRPRSGAVMAMLIIVVPLALALVCVLARLDIIELSQSTRAALLFAHAARPDGDRHADLDRARPLGAHLSVHPLQRRSQDGRARSCSPASTASRSWRSRSSSWPAISSPPAGWRGA